MSFFITRFDPGAKYGGYNQFDCQHAVINKFVKDSLKKQVKQGLSVAYALLEEDGATQRFAGFFTIASHTIALSALGALQRGGLMNHALDIVKVGAQSIGSYGLYLDADAGAFGFYQKLGFVPLEGEKSPAPSPMFLPMSAIP